MKKNNIFGGLGMMSIVILAAFLFIVLLALIFGVFNELEAYQQLFAAMLSVAATGAITAVLLSYQSKQQEELNARQREFDEKIEGKRREFEQLSSEQQRKFEQEAKEDQRKFESETKIKSKIFEEKLAIYKEFLKTLCEVVKDKKIDPEEEIILQFQVANLATHSRSESIQKISDQVKYIILAIKQEEENNNLILGQLFNIADVFYKELYEEENNYDERKRTLAIHNFRSFLVLPEQLDSYEQSNKKQRTEAYKDHTTTEERLQYLSGRLDVPCNRQWIYNGYVLVHEFNNDINPNTGNLVKGDNRIIVDLYMDEKRIQITLFTRQYDENESRKLVNGIWQGKVAYIPNDDKTRHVCADLPIETSDDEIVALMTKLLNEVKQYQVKKYELK